PPSNPLMATPVRDFWPFTPRPPVLPLPEPGPRPTRMRPLVEPGRGASSLSLVIGRLSLRDESPGEYARLGWNGLRRETPKGRRRRRAIDRVLVLHHLDQVVNSGDHAVHRRGVLQGGGAADLVQAQARQGGALVLGPANGARRLTNGDLGHTAYPSASATAAEAPSARRPMTSLTFLPRLEAT